MAGDGTLACPACGASNPLGFRFCGACGAALEGRCPACGSANTAGQRFCGSCGTPLGPAAPATVPVEERKVVTALFADLTASTELATRLDPEDLRGVLRPFFEAMAEEIRRFDGTVEKYIGDAVVAVFGAPIAHEDDPERAIRAALAMQRRLSELNRTIGQELRMRIGLHTGEAVAAAGGRHEGIVTGEVMSVAARLQAAAAPGSVVVGDRTYRDARHAFDFEALGEITAKGVDRPLRVWVVTGERTARPEPSRRTPLVGREHELDLLQLLFARCVREGHANLATVLGPAGIGKSRLSHELADRVLDEHPGARIVRGRCLPYGDGLTYWPLAEILKTEAGILDSDAADEIVQKARATVFDAIGTVEVILSSIGVAVKPDPLSGAEPAVARELLARSWRSFFEGLTGRTPVLALIEDLHWADPSLLELIESLSARVAGSILFLCMARPDLAERRPAWGGGHRSAATLTLSPLTAAESETLVRHLLDHRSAPSDVVGRILERAEGNPFFAGELLRMVLEDGTLVRKDEEWVLERPLPATLPDTVQSVIASRIDMLGPTEKRAVQDAAVVGRVFWEGAVTALAGAGADAALGALAQKGLLYERERSAIVGEREYIFNHILTRDVAYGSITRSRRPDAHRRALGWIEEMAGDRALEFAEILAYHAEQANDAARTARYAMLSGHRSLRVYSAAEAIRWYDRAMTAAAADPEVSASTRAEIALARGEAHEQLGSFVQAYDDYERALAAAREAGDGTLEARALAARPHVLWLQDRFDDGQALLPEALAAARAVGAGDLHSHLLYTAGTIAFGHARFSDALRYHSEALEVAQAHGDLQGEAFARHGLCETRNFVGPYEEGLHQALQARDLFDRIGNRPQRCHNEYMIGYILLHLGRFEEAGRAVTDALIGTRELGARRDEAFALGAEATLALMTGDLAHAYAIADSSIAVALSVPAPRLHLVTYSVIADICLALGADDEARRYVQEAVRLSDQMGSMWYRPIALAFAGVFPAADGDVATAERLFAESAAAGDDVYSGTWAAAAVLEGWRRARDPERLDAAADALEAIVTEECRWLLSPAWFARAHAASLRADWPAVVAAIGRVDAEAARSGYRRFSWEAAALAATALEALGRDDDAAARRREAAEVAQRIGAGLAAFPEMHAAFAARPEVAALLSDTSLPRDR